MKRTKKLTLCLLCLTLLFTGCGAKQPEAEESDVKEEFVNAYFTTDYKERFSTMEGKSEEDLEKYYADFRELATEDCVNRLQANREPLKYDMKYGESGEAIAVQKVSFEEYDDNVYSFEAVLKTESGERTVQGQISVAKEDGLEKVSRISVTW